MANQRLPKEYPGAADVVPVAILEAFRALKFSNLKSFRAIKFSRVQRFRALKL